MSYPLSSPVSSGQPTAYQHYNNLRLDAIHLGQSNLDAITLGSALCALHSGVKLSYLATNRVRIPYNAINPPVLYIDGYLCKATADVDLAASSFSGVQALWYIFANRSAGVTTFTLSVNTSAVPAANQRLIGQVWWDGTNLIQSTLWCYFQREQYPGAFMVRTSNQAIANIIATPIAFNASPNNPSYALSSSAIAFTVPFTGIYLVSCRVAWAAAANGSRRVYFSNVTAGTFMLNQECTITATSTTLVQTSSGIISATAGDNYSILVYQGSGSALNITSAEFRIAPINIPDYGSLPVY